MTHTHAAIHATLTGLLVLALVTAVPGCAAAPPEEDPSIRGTVTSLESGPTGATLLVESGPQPTYAYDRASIRVDGDARVFRATTDSDFEVATFADLALGQQLDVWFTGAVAESYPVQATAGTVVILP